MAKIFTFDLAFSLIDMLFGIFSVFFFFAFCCYIPFGFLSDTEYMKLCYLAIFVDVQFRNLLAIPSHMFSEI